MRRNILKRNLSEDLDWAQELQSNPNYDLMRYIGSEINQYGGSKTLLETRSQASSLERNSFEDLQDDPIQANLWSETNQTQAKGEKTMASTSSAHLSKRMNNKKNR